MLANVKRLAVYGVLFYLALFTFLSITSLIGEVIAQAKQHIETDHSRNDGVGNSREF